jgi:hypothetical protein
MNIVHLYMRTCPKGSSWMENMERLILSTCVSLAPAAPPHSTAASGISFLHSKHSNQPCYVVTVPSTNSTSSVTYLHLHSSTSSSQISKELVFLASHAGSTSLSMAPSSSLAIYNAVRTCGNLVKFQKFQLQMLL